MRSRFRVSMAVLLLLGSAVFAIGVAVERSDGDHHQESTSQELGAPEGSEGREAAERRGRVEAAESSGDESSEEVFGINTESTGVVVAAVIISLLLALAALLVRSPLVLGLIVVVVLGAIAFDVREVMRQVDESRTDVATLAALTAVLHMLTAIVAVVALTIEQRANWNPPRDSNLRPSD